MENYFTEVLWVNIFYVYWIFHADGWIIFERLVKFVRYNTFFWLQYFKDSNYAKVHYVYRNYGKIFLFFFGISASSKKKERKKNWLNDFI